MISLPHDLDRWPETRMMSQRHGVTVNQALAAWFLLYQQLYYAARRFNRSGDLPKDHAEVLDRELKAQCGFGLQEFVDARVLKPVLEASFQGYHCELFARTNGHTRGELSREERARRASLVTRRQRQTDAAVQVAPMLIENWVTADGRAPSPEVVQRARWLVAALDGVFERTRERNEWSPGLIADALAVAEHEPTTELKAFAMWVASYPDRPDMPKNTEGVLALGETLLKTWRGEKG